MLKETNTIAGKSAEELEEEISKLLGGGPFLLIWGAGEKELKKGMPLAILTNMDPQSRLNSIVSYFTAQFQSGEAPFSEIFDLAAMAAVANLLRERAEIRGAVLGGRINVPN